MSVKTSSGRAVPADKTGHARYDVFVVENYADEAGGEKSSWTRLGVAFPHKDTKGFNVELRAIPISGKVVIRLHEPSEKTPG